MAYLDSAQGARREGTAGAIGSADIVAGGVGTSDIADDAVTNDKLNNIARGSVKVGGASNAPTDLNAKTSGNILVGDGTDVLSVAVSGDATLAANGAVTIANTAVSTAKIANLAVTKAKSLTFFSTEQTGTGSSQNVAHGLGAVPAGVLVGVTESDGNAFDVAEGAHDGTNVVVTVTSGVKFKVFAWA